MKKVHKGGLRAMICVVSVGGTGLGSNEFIWHDFGVGYRTDDAGWWSIFADSADPAGQGISEKVQNKVENPKCDRNCFPPQIFEIGPWRVPETIFGHIEVNNFERKFISLHFPSTRKSLYVQNFKIWISSKGYFLNMAKNTSQGLSMDQSQRSGVENNSYHTTASASRNFRKIDFSLLWLTRTEGLPGPSVSTPPRTNRGLINTHKGPKLLILAPRVRKPNCSVNWKIRIFPRLTPYARHPDGTLSYYHPSQGQDGPRGGVVDGDPCILKIPI